MSLTSQPKQDTDKKSNFWKRHWRLLLTPILLAVLIASLFAFLGSPLALVVYIPSGTVSEASEIAIVVTLAVLFWQIRGDTKSREFDTYEKLMSDFSDVTLKLMDNDSLAEEVYKEDNRPDKWGTYTPEEKRAYSYFDSLLGLFERVWIAKKARNLETREVEAWRVWLRDLASIGIFMDVYTDNEGQFDSSLMREVGEFIATAKKRKAFAKAKENQQA